MNGDQGGVATFLLAGEVFLCRLKIESRRLGRCVAFLLLGVSLNVSLSSGVPADIEPCVDAELHQFPLRMRDWLKNVLVTLYERDIDNNLLTEKQKLRVRIPFLSFRDLLLLQPPEGCIHQKLFCTFVDLWRS